MQYQCDNCGMRIKELQCGHCNAELVEKTIDVNGKKVKVCECPNDCGKIKSPTCCGHDMNQTQ